MATRELAPTPFIQIPEVESAPQTGADFLPVNPDKPEQLYLPDELPNVSALSNDFNHLLAGLPKGKYRAGAAMDYAVHLKARFHPGNYALDNAEYARSQVTSRLYLDMMILTARRNEYHTLLKQIGKRRTAASLPSLHRLIGAKLDAQHEITDYQALFPEKSTKVLFGNLSIMMHHGRRVLYGDEVTFEKAKQQDIMQLLAMLAEYKVLSALQEEWPQATFGSVEEDQNGTDIVIPSSVQGETIALQVKSKMQPEYNLTILDEETAIPQIRVPMNMEHNDPFKLSQEHSSVVRRFVRQTSPRRLAIAV